MHFWIRGTAIANDRAWHQRAVSLIQKLRGIPTENAKHVYQRCLLMYRSYDNAVHIKLFKNIEDDRLELLVPDIKVEMSDFDKYLLYFSMFTVAGTAGYRLFTNQAIHLGVMSKSLAVLATIAGLVGFRYWEGLRNSRYKYLANHTNILYLNNISDNRGALALLVDRATVSISRY